MIDRLGPYRIEKLLGRGGMGTVYAGVHDETGERAALKALSVHLVDDPDFRGRFISEIDTLRKLNHPNIVQLYGEGVQDGYLFYVMQYVEGSSLQQELQRGHRFEWRDVSRIAIDICAALQHAHDRGVIHRDLKPANLLRDTQGRIKLTDFGIAKLFGGSQLTAVGSVMGTADYMPPEQAEGRQVTSRSDLYSLGSVMFTLLARRPPYSGESPPQVIRRMRSDKVPSVRQFAPNVPHELDRIIGQLLEKKPEARIATPRALANRLKAMEHGLGIAGLQPPASELGADGEEPDSQAIGAAATVVSPTAVDGEQRDAASYSWNSSTGITSENSAAAEHIADQDTVAEEAVSTENRFRMADPELFPCEPESPANPGAVGGHLNTLLLALALVGVVVVTAWGMWPASADSLYSRIDTKTRQHGPAEAKKEIHEFLKRFPSDARSPTIEGLRMDIESESLRSHLALRELMSGGSDLEPFEEQYLGAMRLKRKNVPAARARFRELIETYRGLDQRTAELDRVLGAAQHQLRRLEETSAPQPES